MANLTDAFNECVDRVIAGESIERCVQDYPEYAERLHQLLETGELVHRAHYPGAVVADAQDEVRGLVIQTYRRKGERTVRQRSWFFPLAAVATLVLVVGVVSVVLLGTNRPLSNFELTSVEIRLTNDAVQVALNASETASDIRATQTREALFAGPTAIVMEVTPLAETTLGPIMTMTYPGTVTPPVYGTPMPTEASTDTGIEAKPSATVMPLSVEDIQLTATALAPLLGGGPTQLPTVSPGDVLLTATYTVLHPFPTALPDTGGGVVPTSVVAMSPAAGTEVAHSIPTVSATMLPTTTMTVTPTGTPMPTATREWCWSTCTPVPTPFQQQNFAPTPTPAIIPLNAGEIDDNERWDSYLQYRNNFLEQYGVGVVHDINVTGRQIIRVTDMQGVPVLGAQVQVFAGQTLVSDTRTYATGETLFFPNARQESQNYQSPFRVTVTKDNVGIEFDLDPQHGPLWDITFDGLTFTLDRIQLDVLFLLDTTSSMSDEIAQLQNNILGISSQIAALPGNIDVRYGLVTYRDRGDEYNARVYDFTADVNAFQASLSGESASGGGDEPEDLNTGLQDAMRGPSWRGDDAVKLVFLIGDAPPHLDYQDGADYVEELAIATMRGIKIHPIASSGLNQVGEYIYRQIAQYTMGHFIFLTYDQGTAGAPGDTRPDLNVGEPDDPVSQQDQGEYTVERLDELVLRLITDELALLPEPQQTSSVVPVDVIVSKTEAEPPQTFNPAILLVLIGASFLLGYSATLVRGRSKPKRKNDEYYIDDDEMADYQ